MKKLFLSVICSIMFLFIFWSLIGFSRYGSDLVNKHLDLYSMIGGKQFSFNFTAFNANFEALNNVLHMTRDTNPILNGIVGWFNNNGLNLKGSGWNFVIDILNAMFNPLAMIVDILIVPVFLTIMIMPVIGSFLDIIIWTVGFVFNPIFI